MLENPNIIIITRYIVNFIGSIGRDAPFAICCEAYSFIFLGLKELDAEA